MIEDSILRNNLFTLQALIFTANLTKIIML
ncbi:Uncharacterised protein [Yersinia enterocolitica]|nr:Uncharacterised protein [Yersinia enterocolitica]CRY07614.1 Uncharacterised protein [Yersinia enterocolitica]